MIKGKKARASLPLPLFNLSILMKIKPIYLWTHYHKKIQDNSSSFLSYGILNLIPMKCQSVIIQIRLCVLCVVSPSLPPPLQSSFTK